VVVVVEHIHMTPGWETSSARRPQPADNLRDLEAHADDFENRTGSSGTVLEPASGDVIGCVYIYPDDSERHDARVARGAGSWPELDVQLWRAVMQTGSRTSGRSSVWLTPSAPTPPDATAPG
jgi:hypothetical protein